MLFAGTPWASGDRKNPQCEVVDFLELAGVDQANTGRVRVKFRCKELIPSPYTPNRSLVRGEMKCDKSLSYAMIYSEIHDYYCRGWSAMFHFTFSDFYDAGGFIMLRYAW